MSEIVNFIDLIKRFPTRTSLLNVAPSSEAEIRGGRRVEGELRPRVEVPDVRPAAVRDLETGPAGATPRASSSVENSLLK